MDNVADTIKDLVWDNANRRIGRTVSHHAWLATRPLRVQPDAVHLYLWRRLNAIHR